MDIDLPKSQEAFLMRLVEQGVFVSVDEAVRAAIREQELRMERTDPSIEELRESVAGGIEAALRGDVVSLDPGKIRREGMKILEERRRLNGA